MRHWSWGKDMIHTMGGFETYIFLTFFVLSFLNTLGFIVVSLAEVFGYGS